MEGMGSRPSTDIKYTRSTGNASRIMNLTYMEDIKYLSCLQDEKGNV
jgi:hypothetical protein